MQYPPANAAPRITIANQDSQETGKYVLRLNWWVKRINATREAFGSIIVDTERKPTIFAKEDSSIAIPNTDAPI
jgi:hypothetical protein